MSLKERIYSVLIVSASKSFDTAFSAFLPESNYDPVHYAPSISYAKRALKDRTYDFVIVNSPLPDDSGVNFAIDACNISGTVALLIVKADIKDEITDIAGEYGVFTMAKPASKSTVETALSWMSAARERLRNTEKKTLSLEEKMEEIRIINKAKWLLISNRDMPEAEAHRYIEKQAMDRCMQKVAVAREIISLYS